MHPTLGSTRLLLLALGLSALLACPTPDSRPAGGEVGNQVETSIASGAGTFDHSAWGSLLAAASRNGLIDYTLLADRRPELHSYLDELGEVSLGSLQASHLKALLINAYNALTVESILQHPEVSSIRDINGVWDRARHRVGGFDLTLDEIEHTLLRPYFKDPRIHFAVNCASLSCAPLPSFAYEGKALEEQLEQATREFLADPAHLRVDGSRLLLSRYFDWYGGDFVRAGWHPRADSIAEFVRSYASADAARQIGEAGELEIDFLDYDWALNALPQ